VRKQEVEADDLRFTDLIYSAGGAQEHFMSFDTPDDHLAGFLRLSLPGKDSPDTAMPDLKGAAIIREVHIYGQSLPVGAGKEGAAQHTGLGTELLQKAGEISRAAGFSRLEVISAVGTRRYYLERGFQRGELYLIKQLT
jgi:elongator complex protein 3